MPRTTDPRGRTEYRPSKADLAAAINRTVPDLIAPGLEVLFVGINPGLWSAATRHHFARPGNRFWPALHAAGFTERLLKPWEEQLLLDEKIGITNLVSRATVAAAELSPEELRKGRQRLSRKVRRFQPACVAMVGIGAYRIGFDRPRAVIGLQAERFEGSALWVLPNPSGLNANHQLPEMTQVFTALRTYVETEAGVARAAPVRS